MRRDNLNVHYCDAIVICEKIFDVFKKPEVFAGIHSNKLTFEVITIISVVLSSITHVVDEKMVNVRIGHVVEITQILRGFAR